MKLSKVLFSAAALSLSALAVSAQDEGFDLSSQRGEVQEFNPVDGHKVDHHGLVINPTPQSILRPNGGVADISNGFKIKDKQKKFAGDLGFLTKSDKGLPLEIEFGKKAAAKAGVKPLSGAYLLNISSKSVKIIGYDERGAYYGLQTLRQVTDSRLAAEKGGLPVLIVNDYPAMKYRGVVEGFYGTPWSHQVRLSLLDYYGANKLSDYLYGPKDDPYHSSPYWRQPYPEDQARNIRELVERARKNRVNFVWAIHPGKDIRWNKADYDSLVNKFNMMYDLGVRSFAIFFDDIEGEGTNPARQVELLNNLTADFVKAKGDVTNLIICPTDYSQLWAKPGPDGPLAVYGRTLNPDVEVMWTGAVVCSDLTPETLEFIDSRIKRPALYWWNYPVTDYCRHIIMQGPVYGLDTSLTPDQVVGIVSNPMEHGEASKIALYGVADYAWNPTAYNPIDNWERGIVDRVPLAPEAYRTFTIHSTDTETGYRRDESWETTIFPFNSYTPAQFNALKAEFEKVTKAEDQLRKSANPALVSELSPWLTQFTALGQRGLRTLDLIKTFETGNDSIFWNAYTANVMTPAQREAFEAHKIGTMKLHTFYEKSMDGMVKAFFEKLTGKKPMMPAGAGSYPNLRTTQAKLMLDGDTATYYTSANSQKAGDWIGLDLLETRPVDEVLVKQGRNSIDDVDYFDNVILEYSADGRTWNALTPGMEKTYVIHHKGEPVNARYVRLRRLDSEKSNWASVREFSVNPATAERVGLNLAAADMAGALMAFDTDLNTSMNLDGDFAFDRVPEAATLIVLGDGGGNITVSQLDKDGKEISSVTAANPYTKVTLLGNTARVKVSGKSRIFEVVQK